jgi:peptidoglycan-associated lipoprotein
MEKRIKEVVITIAIAALVFMQGCSHTKKETAAAPDTAAQQVVAPESEDTDVMAEGKILNTIYFNYDKADLQPSSIEVLKKIGAWLSKNPEKKIRIEGHCDERGTDEYNIALGERRALAAKNYLSTMGISMQNITTLSFGEEKPAVPGHTEDAWSQNRRDEFKIVK